MTVLAGIGVIVLGTLLLVGLSYVGETMNRARREWKEAEELERFRAAYGSAYRERHRGCG